MMGPIPKCYIPNFMVIGRPVPEKKDVEGFCTIYEHDDHLGHVTQMLRTNFRSPTHRGSRQNSALIGQAISENMFEHCERLRTTTTDAGAWVIILYKIT